MIVLSDTVRRSIGRSIYLAGGCRAFATGLTSILLALHVAEAGLGPADLGVLVGAGMGGITLGTAIVAWFGEGVGRGRIGVVATAVSATGLIGLGLVPTTPLLPLIAFLGMINGMGRDRGPLQTIDESVLADRTNGHERTSALARYTLVQDLAGASGALAAGAPAVFAAATALSVGSASRWTFVALGLLTLLPVIVYRTIHRESGTGRGRLAAPLSGESRRRVIRLSALFAIDSLGGGFLAASVVAFWFFERFALQAAVLGAVFFAARGLNAISYPIAARLARRFGLLNTMVFTHAPSSVLLLALPFVPSPGLAVTLFCLRELMVEMDVPTRQSYVAAVTRAGERTFAIGATGIVRTAGWALGSGLAGLSMARFGIGAPLVVGACLKLLYDTALYAGFRRVRSDE